MTTWILLWLLAAAVLGFVVWAAISWAAWEDYRGRCEPWTLGGILLHFALGLLTPVAFTAALGFALYALYCRYAKGALSKPLFNPCDLIRRLW